METTTRKATQAEPSISDAVINESKLPERPSARAQKPAGPPPTKHEHPRSECDVIAGHDDNGRRVIRQVMGRELRYFAGCKLCQHLDQKRMAAPPTLENLSQTLFLVPEPEYDNMVARAYIATRYPDAENIVHAFHAEKLSYVKGAQIVVVTRRGLSGKVTGPRTKRTKDEEGTFYDAPIPPDTYLAECVESEPIVVADCLDVVPATMFSDQSVDMTELVARLAEVAAPFRIAPPADPKDRMYVMRLNS